jgi:hypothetical protein
VGVNKPGTVKRESAVPQVLITVSVVLFTPQFIFNNYVFLYHYIFVNLCLSSGGTQKEAVLSCITCWFLNMDETFLHILIKISLIS